MKIGFVHQRIIFSFTPDIMCFISYLNARKLCPTSLQTITILNLDGKWLRVSMIRTMVYLTTRRCYARNTWSGNYYLKSNGEMAKKEWVYDKNYASYYYLTSEGSHAS